MGSFGSSILNRSPPCNPNWDCFFDVISRVRKSSRAGGRALHYFICSCPGIFRSASSYRLHEPTTRRFKHLSGVFYDLFCSFSVLFRSSHLTNPHFLPAFRSIPPTRTGTVNPKTNPYISIYPENWYTIGILTLPFRNVCKVAHRQSNPSGVFHQQNPGSNKVSTDNFLPVRATDCSFRWAHVSFYVGLGGVKNYMSLSPQFCCHTIEQRKIIVLHACHFPREVPQ